MLIKELLDNPVMLERYKSDLDDCKREHPDMDWSGQEIETIKDSVIDYNEFVKVLKDEFGHYSLINDDLDNLDGVYVCDLWEAKAIELYSDYKVIRNYSSCVSRGVCDNASQVMKHYMECLEKDYFDSSKQYIIMLTPITKASQPERDGWRWHKWGDYIGIQDDKHEYLYDEDDIDMVYVFDINEIVNMSEK